MFESEPFFVAPFTGGSEEWWLSGSAIDLDFENNRYYENTDGQAVTSYLSCSRASIGYATNADGTITQFGNDTLRITSNGLLVEDARENLALQSQTFNTNWEVLNCSVAASAVTAPNGTTTAWDATITNGSSFPAVRQSISTPAATPATLSVYIRPGLGSTWIQIEHSIFNGTDFARAWFNLTGTGTVGTTTVGGTFTIDGTSTIEALANGWFRVSFTCHSTSGGGYFAICGPVVGDGNETGGAVNDFFTIWGAQLELGAFPSSLIPTSSASATRAADLVACINNLDTILAAAQASIVVDDTTIRPVAAGGGVAPIVLTTGGVFILAVTSADPTQLYCLLPSSINVTFGNSLSSYTGAKVGVCWDGSGRSLVGGGGSVASDANTIPSRSYDLANSSASATGSWQLFRRLTVWDYRLANATMQALTAP